MDSDMGLILDMMPDDNVVFETIESGKNNEYYQAHAEHILKNIDNVDHYFHFVYTILKNYHTLSDEQRTKIRDRMGLRPELVERVVIKEKVVYKNEKKAKLNQWDDY